VKAPKGSQTLVATDSCFYSIDFFLESSELAGVVVNNGVIEWQNNDLKLIEKTYAAVIKAVFNANPTQVTKY
jgi:hypothetical protein